MKNVINKVSYILCFILMITLVACSNSEYKILLDYAGVSQEQTEYSVKDGENMPRLPVLSDDWRDFEGWYSTKDGVEFKVYDGNRYVVDNGKLNIKHYDCVDNTIVFKAKYTNKQLNCFIELEGNNERFNDRTIQVMYGENLPKLDNLSRDYSKFLGWYTMYNGSEVLVHNGTNFINGYETLDVDHYNLVNYTTKIYAKYLSNSIKVNFQGNSDKYSNNSSYISYGESLPELPIPEKDNYVFLGWYSLKDNEEFIVYDKNGFVANRNLLLTSNYDIKNNEVNIYAKYEIVKKQVTLMLGNSISANSVSVYVPYGENITEYVKNIRIDGKVVTKWSTVIDDKNFENTFVGPVVNDGIILYPSENIYFLITLMGDKTTEIYALEKQKITLQSLTRDGYDFIGWEDASGNVYLNEMEVNEEKTLIAKFLKTGPQSIAVRTQGYSDPYIYTPKGADQKPTKRDWEDKVIIDDYYNISDLKKYGYIGFTIEYSCSISVKDDGYQHIYFYNNSQMAGAFLIHEKKFDYAEGKTDIKITFDATFSNLPNGYLSIRYAASGYFNELFYSHGNQWNCSNVVVKLTPHK